MPLIPALGGGDKSGIGGQREYKARGDKNSVTSGVWWRQFQSEDRIAASV